MQFVISALGLIPHIIVLVATLIYLSKRTSGEGVLMLLGAFVGTLSSAFYTFALPWLFETFGSEWYQNYAILIGIVNTLGYLCFALGLLILVLNVAKAKA